ncbi:MAG TPA: hybrid sensor histidine kinase/response regulator [Verrucomicrobiales bacterium]|nr:hybrid sensor histidine kinase/response regulator [Verrucomicrobiales bacterium]
MTTPNHETILIVDDQEENLRGIGNVLSLMAYDIILASSAEQGLQRLSAATPDLILLDVMMPGTDGLTACRQIKAEARWADIPVIFLSADDDKNVIVQALEAGGVDYVTKPFNMAELVSRVRTQLALKRARDQLRALAEDKDELMGIMAHDLKNSLAGMRLSACLLQARLADLPSRCAPLVNNIVNASERMLAFMQEFLANQCAEQLQMRCEAVNLGEVVAKVAAAHQTAAGTKKITLTWHAPKEAVLVMADIEGVTQTLENLVSNAIKFTPEGGEVRITARQPTAGMVKCLVSDTGPGFTPEDRTKMFQRYGRLSAQPTGDEPSTGLGLSIVKRLMDAMGGTVTLAESTGNGAGAEFIIALPVPA